MIFENYRSKIARHVSFHENQVRFREISVTLFFEGDPANLKNRICMKRRICLAGIAALLLAAHACTEKKGDKERNPAGTIQINGRSENVRDVYYMEEPADEETGKCIALLILRAEGAPGVVEPEFYVSFELSESLCDGTIDLSRPLEASGWPLPYLYISARNGAKRFTVDYDEDPIAEMVREGSLSVTRNGEQFSIRILLERTDGNRLQAEWTGTASKLSAP